MSETADARVGDGGPAFPVSTGDASGGHQDGPSTWQFPGMSLRDHFAGLAMQAMVTKSNGQGATGGAKGVPLIARYAYEFADAMIRTRTGAPHD